MMRYMFEESEVNYWGLICLKHKLYALGHDVPCLNMIRSCHSQMGRVCGSFNVLTYKLRETCVATPRLERTHVDVTPPPLGITTVAWCMD